jgi:hypothetical protein
MPPKTDRSPALLALTASALAALGPGRAQAQQAAPVSPQVDYRFSFYREGDLPASKLAGGDRERYEILTHQFRLTRPLDDETSLSADLTLETMSGASPMYVQPDANGKPIQVMSGASIDDTRVDVLLGANRRRGDTAGSISVGFSTEDDYQAVNLSTQGEYTLADTVTTLSAGLGYSHDRIEPTQGDWPVGVDEDTRSAATVFGGLARVLDSVTVVQTSLSYTLHDGFLADPYKRAWRTDIVTDVADARPDERGQFTWLTRLRRFFKRADAALHADYRYYHDDWKVDAHTVDLSWHQRLGGLVRLVPGVRWYSQSQAYFYSPFYDAPRADGLASSDYRLSPYGARSFRLTASAEVYGWGASLGYETYDSDARYALDDVAVENPGLVDFDIVSLGFKKVF